MLPGPASYNVNMDSVRGEKVQAFISPDKTSIDNRSLDENRDRTPGPGHYQSNQSAFDNSMDKNFTMKGEAREQYLN